MFRRLWKNFWFTAYDWRGNARWLLGRANDPSASAVSGIADTARDTALEIICACFDIPRRQMYCLRLDDELDAIYREMNGPRDFDQLQYERLLFELEDRLRRDVPAGELSRVKTVGGVVRLVAG